jgi:hypothetical protein
MKIRKHPAENVPVGQKINRKKDAQKLQHTGPNTFFLCPHLTHFRRFRQISLSG